MDMTTPTFPTSTNASGEKKKHSYCIFDWKEKKDAEEFKSNRFISSSASGAAKKAFDTVVGKSATNNKNGKKTVTVYLRQCSPKEDKDIDRKIWVIHAFQVSRSLRSEAVKVTLKNAGGKELTFKWDKTAKRIAFPGQDKPKKIYMNKETKEIVETSPRASKTQKIKEELRAKARAARKAASKKAAAEKTKATKPKKASAPKKVAAKVNKKVTNNKAKANKSAKAAVAVAVNNKKNTKA